MEQVLDDYPYLEREDILAALAFAADSVRASSLRGNTKGEEIVNLMAGTSTAGWTTDELMDQLRGE